MDLRSRGRIPAALFVTVGCLGWIGAGLSQSGPAGQAQEPIRFLGDYKVVDPVRHDGGLPPVFGVHNFQVLRANRTHPPDTGHRGYTYNHQPMLSWWNGRFYLEYAAAHHNESEDATEAFLTSSEDGVRWSPPLVVFPAIEYENWKRSLAHHRMGFHVAPNGRLLVISFYGIPQGPSRLPNAGVGIGRVVREIYKDGSLGPVYFIRYMPHTGYTEQTNARWFPSFRSSPDKGFVEACEALLSNKLATQQWWEEDRSQDGFYSLSGTSEYETLKALSFYHRRDGAVVGLWKFKWAALTFDEGKSWTQPVKLPSFRYGGAKVWGQGTGDGRFAVFYNPHESRRYPLIVNTSDDGILFDQLFTVHGEVPEQRFQGAYRETGPQYVRGIEEGTGKPPDGRVWLSYSMNKEDIWVTALPSTISAAAPGWVDDDFEALSPGPFVKDWNIYSPLWAPVGVAVQNGNQVLRLEDRDPYDYAKAVRLFPESREVEISLRLLATPAEDGRLEFDLVDRQGNRPVRIELTAPEHHIRANSAATLSRVGEFRKGEWITLDIRANAGSGVYDLAINGSPVLRGAKFAQPDVTSLQRIEFRTGTYRMDLPRESKRMPLMDNGLPGADEQLLPSAFCIDDVRIRKGAVSR
jgi:hypothetical protein